MADAPPAVRHALSDLLKVLRGRREYLGSLRGWCAKCEPYIKGKEGELPEPEEGPLVFEGEWERAAERCAKWLRIIGRPDLAEQMLAFVDEAPDLLAALDAKDLEQYRAGKDAELLVLERAIEQVEWLLEQHRELRDLSRQNRQEDEPNGAKRPRLTKREVQLRTAAAITHKIQNPQADRAECARAADIPESTLRGRPEWNEWLPRIVRSAQNGDVSKVSREWDKRIGEYVMYRTEDD